MHVWKRAYGPEKMTMEMRSRGCNTINADLTMGRRSSSLDAIVLSRSSGRAGKQR